MKVNKNDLITRNYTFEIRADENESNESVIVGRPIVYGSRTDISGFFEEIIDVGALANTDLNDVRFLVNHDTSKIPLARSRKGDVNSTMQLTVDNDGLGIRVVLDTENNADARSLYSAIQRGDVSGMSFGFYVDGETWENLNSDYPTRHITSIQKVIEVSAVTFPAYEATSIAARDKLALDDARAVIHSVKKDDLELEKLKIEYLYKF